MVLDTWQVVSEYPPANVTFPAIKHGSGTASGALKKCPLLMKTMVVKTVKLMLTLLFPLKHV